MTTEQTFFKKVADLFEREKLFEDLCKTPCEILAKEHSPGTEVTLLKAEVYSSPEISLRPLDPEFRFKESGEIILQLTIGSEKYLYSAKYQLRAGIIKVKSTEPLYHLQRREDFRLKLPSTLGAVFNVEVQTGAKNSRKLKIVDLSAGGCRLFENHPSSLFALDDKIFGTLEIAQRDKIQVSGKIVHSLVEDGQKSQSIGILFTQMSAPAKNKIAGLVMDLYRQLFSKLN